MKKAIVYVKDYYVQGAEGLQLVKKVGDIERLFDDEFETPNGFLFSNGLVEVVDCVGDEVEQDLYEFDSESKTVGLNADKVAARDAILEEVEAKNNKKKAARQLLRGKKEDLKSPTVAKLGVILEALVNLMEDE